MVVIILLPGLSAIAPDEEPLVTCVPFIFTVAVASVVVGVNVMLVVELLTEAVYPAVADENAGLNVPELKINALKVATEPAALVTVNV